jgi:Domain of unknown function (DUF1707)
MMTAGSYASMRASTADLDRSVEVLKAGFVEGRLTKEELEERVGQAFVARFFGELMVITADLPVGTFGRLPAHPVTPPFPRTTRLDVAVLLLVWLVLLVILAVVVMAA